MLKKPTKSKFFHVQLDHSLVDNIQAKLQEYGMFCSEQENASEGTLF